ncbi:hypothetical protein ACT7C6_32940 [Bacillus paranthracis]
MMKQLVENMLTGYYKLSAQTLNNDELFRLMYTCIDYENAQVNTSFQASAFPMSIGEQTKKGRERTLGSGYAIQNYVERGMQSGV